MYSYISGELTEITNDSIVVDNHGIGYLIFVPRSVLVCLPHPGEQVKIYTYLNVREDAMQLFGFLSQDELALFRLLLGVNGIGPKGALAILSVLTPEDLRFAVLSEDAKAIAAAPGIGAKTAQRVLLDLKDQIDKIPSMGMITNPKTQAPSRARKEAMEALSALGYSGSEAARALDGLTVSENTTTEELLKEALKRIAFL